MTDKRSYLISMIEELRVGERLKIRRSIFEQAFRCGWPSIYRTPREALLSCLVSSGWGAWRVDQDIVTGDYIVSRHEPGNRRVYVDPDREHLFQKLPDGSYEPIGK